MICGCYRRDEAQDPETFAAALAAVLADYPASIVEYAADPRTGVIKAFPMGLPSVGQIGQFLDDTLARQDRINRYAALPKTKLLERPRPKAEPNLFVPDTAHRYGAMVKRADKEPERARYGSNVCADGVNRNGIFVPLNWYEDPTTTGDDTLAQAARRTFEQACAAGGIDPAGGVSPALLKNLEEHDVVDA
jgi:hypothetical protein